MKHRRGWIVSKINSPNGHICIRACNWTRAGICPTHPMQILNHVTLSTRVKSQTKWCDSMQRDFQLNNKKGTNILSYFRTPFRCERMSTVNKALIVLLIELSSAHAAVSSSVDRNFAHNQVKVLIDHIATVAGANCANCASGCGPDRRSWTVHSGMNLCWLYQRWTAHSSQLVYEETIQKKTRTGAVNLVYYYILCTVLTVKRTGQLPTWWKRDEPFYLNFSQNRVA